MKKDITETCKYCIEGRCTREPSYCYYNANLELCILDRMQALGERPLFYRKTFREKYKSMIYKERKKNNES